MASLLSLSDSGQMESFYMRGALFENFVVSELLKKRIFSGRNEDLYFWRDSNGIEIDVLEEDGVNLRAYEIKASETMNGAFFSNIKKMKDAAGIKFEDSAVIYGGDRDLPPSEFSGAYISWRSI